MELEITNINKVVYEQARKAFRRFIKDEYEDGFGASVTLKADEISISYSKDPFASDILNIRLYNRSISSNLQGYTGIFQLDSRDFGIIAIS